MTNDILKELRSAQGFISGQALCDKLGVSRTAVWKRIRALANEGYVIEAVPNRGYRLVESPDVLSEEDLKDRIKTKRMGREVRCFDRIGSTNQYAKNAAEEGAPEGLLITADEQTRGRGRSGHTWSTPPGQAIAMTLLLRPPLPAEKISMTTLVMGLAVCRACRRLYNLDAMIKWPNDVVIGNHKICGILTEMSTDMESVSYIVIGIGINVNITGFPDELKDIATSICLELGRKVSRAELIAAVMEEFEQCYDTFLENEDLSDLMDEYNEYLVNKGREVRVLSPDSQYQGTAQGIDKAGCLLVMREDGSVEAVYAGEVSVRGLYGYV